ncbi:MAG: SRPBCC family protein [Chloroflexi bacterium]|nr:SRPBCC family protein [Chloroflexota bacterium]
MVTIKESVLVASTPERVWSAVVDFEARPQWSSRVKEAHVLDGAPLREGSRILLVVGRDRFTATVVEIRPQERLALLVKGPGFRVNHVYELRPSGDGTDVALAGEYGGIIGRLAARFMGGSVRRDLVEELAAIRSSAEPE